MNCGIPLFHEKYLNFTTDNSPLFFIHRDFLEGEFEDPSPFLLCANKFLFLDVQDKNTLEYRFLDNLVENPKRLSSSLLDEKINTLELFLEQFCELESQFYSVLDRTLKKNILQGKNMDYIQER